MYGKVQDESDDVASGNSLQRASIASTATSSALSVPRLATWHNQGHCVSVVRLTLFMLHAILRVDHVAVAVLAVFLQLKPVPAAKFCL